MMMTSPRHGAKDSIGEFDLGKASISDPIVVYCHGMAQNNNIKKGGLIVYACVFPDYPGHTKARTAGYGGPQRAAYKASRAAIKIANKLDKKGKRQLEIISNNKIMNDGMNEWIYKWKDNGWMTVDKTPVKHSDLLKKMDAARKKRKIKWRLVDKGDADDQRYHEQAVNAAKSVPPP